MIDTRTMLVEKLRTRQALLKKKATTRFAPFVKYTKPNYDMQWFHKLICDKLQLFAEGKIKKMMILLPPQHGKSELATRRLPPYLLGRNPNLKIAVASYSDTMVQGFNRDIQRIIDSELYFDIFPETVLNNSKIAGVSVDNYARNYHEFQIVNKEGSVKTVGRGGALTGSPVDIGIIDDLYKDRAEAKSVAISLATWDWYTDVFKTRLHNESQQLIMNTRWDQNDLCGRLLLDEPGEWDVVQLPAIRTTDKNSYDIRVEGDPLYPSKHSLERLLAVKRQSQVTFNSLYQQDPKPNADLLIYPNVIIIDEFPNDIETFFWGLDFGFTNDPTCLVKSAVSAGPAENGKLDLYLEECCYSTAMPMREVRLCAEAHGWKSGQPIFCDHVPPNIEELRSKQKMSAFSAIKGEGSLNAGIEKMKEYNIHVTRRSVNAINESRNYQWVTYGNIITNEPVDELNHFWDAARYGVYTRFFRQRK
jgi:hypothetical protein